MSKDKQIHIKIDDSKKQEYIAKAKVKGHSSLTAYILFLLHND